MQRPKNRNELGEFRTYPTGRLVVSRQGLDCKARVAHHTDWEVWKW